MLLLRSTIFTNLFVRFISTSTIKGKKFAFRLSVRDFLTPYFCWETLPWNQLESEFRRSFLWRGRWDLEPCTTSSNKVVNNPIIGFATRRNGEAHLCLDVEGRSYRLIDGLIDWWIDGWIRCIRKKIPNFESKLMESMQQLNRVTSQMSSFNISTGAGYLFLS